MKLNPTKYIHTRKRTSGAGVNRQMQSTLNATRGIARPWQDSKDTVDCGIPLGDGRSRYVSRVYIYMRKDRQTPSPDPQATKCVEPLNSIDVTSSWGRGERENLTSPHWSNTEPTTFRRDGEERQPYNTHEYTIIPLFQSLSFKRW